ncbi:hypothetical protein H9P43_009116 [Blastocladiella emersonii ATCC 22665]|nr:hypothetical protein H9P43_009116 [Blastocladiella emersonii ATCC 22665]
MDRILAQHIMPNVERIAEAQSEGKSLAEPKPVPAAVEDKKPEKDADGLEELRASAQRAVRNLDDPDHPPMMFSESFVPTFDTVAFAYGLMVMGGGFVGYSQAQSLTSLYMGSACGLVIFFATYVLSKRPRSLVGMVPLIAVAMVLLAVMTRRFMQTRTFFPAGWLAVNSIMICGRYMERLAFATMKTPSAPSTTAEGPTKPKSE